MGAKRLQAYNLIILRVVPLDPTIKYFFRAEMERKKQAKNSKPHIKKPLNAFMLYMKEQRAKVVSECTLKESAAINQILGRKVSHSYSTTNPPPFHEMEFFYRGGPRTELLLID